MRKSAIALAVSGLLCASSLAWSNEVITYSYDAKGRLIQVVRTGSVNNGVSATYSYDAADNRSQVVVTGSSGGGGSFFTVNDASVTEGGTVVFTITRSGDTSSAQSVTYASAGNSAVSGTDFNAVGAAVTFAIGETTKTIKVTTIQDTFVEGAETFTLNLSAPTGGATISDAHGVGTINDDDVAPTSSFAVNDASASEGGTVGFTITRSGDSSTAQSVTYASASNSAVSGTDFNAVGATATFAIGETSKPVNVTTIQDALVESNETFFLNLTAPTGGATISDAQGLGTINDDDTAPPPSFAINDVAVAENGGSVTFTVTKTGSTSSTFTVNYATSDGTAVAPGDYNAILTTTLTFLAADTTKTFNVTINDDSLVEGNEAFNVTLSGASGGATISDPAGIGTITDNDTAPSNNPPVTNGDSITLRPCASGSVNVVANDSDPDGNYPLALTGVTSDGWAGVESSTNIGVAAPEAIGTYIAEYTVRDSLGATATGTLTLNVSGTNQCF
jgi:hypothetical protein